MVATNPGAYTRQVCRGVPTNELRTMAQEATAKAEAHQRRTQALVQVARKLTALAQEREDEQDG